MSIFVRLPHVSPTVFANVAYVRYNRRYHDRVQSHVLMFVDLIEVMFSLHHPNAMNGLDKLNSLFEIATESSAAGSMPARINNGIFTNDEVELHAQRA